MSRPSSPTPSEREKKDREARAKEAAEQATLPYKWEQTIQDVDITTTIPANMKARDLDVVITKTKLKVAIKGQEPIIDVRSSRLPRPFAPSPLTSALAKFRATCRSRSTPTRAPGRWRRSRVARRSPFTWTRLIRWSGGSTS